MVLKLSDIRSHCITFVVLVNQNFFLLDLYPYLLGNPPNEDPIIRRRTNGLHANRTGGLLTVYRQATLRFLCSIETMDTKFEDNWCLILNSEYSKPIIKIRLLIFCRNYRFYARQLKGRECGMVMRAIYS
jgi:hypothetical protein